MSQLDFVVCRGMESVCGINCALCAVGLKKTEVAMLRTCSPDYRGSCSTCPFLPELTGEKSDPCDGCEATEEVCITCEVHTPPDLREDAVSTGLVDGSEYTVPGEWVPF